MKLYCKYTSRTSFKSDHRLLLLKQNPAEAINSDIDTDYEQKILTLILTMEEEEKKVMLYNDV